MRPAQPSSQKKRQTRRGCVVARRFVSIESAVSRPATTYHNSSVATQRGGLLMQRHMLNKPYSVRALDHASTFESYCIRQTHHASPALEPQAPSQCTQDMSWHNAKQHLRLIALIGRLVKYPMARHDTARCSLSRADIVLWGDWECFKPSLSAAGRERVASKPKGAHHLICSDVRGHGPG
ncbi:hypothetical protein CSHISOI_05302 [Colletotrichum shisoi]|uniref:Uncharacterized protein n=1 Tax=Colletotrichum shisoi TaxID=2078593 RepID=A0A5Q4BT00_9PEZI|nr:hypothetical protein CSHISOI_05302 [Colletotrichum shisoi]